MEKATKREVTGEVVYLDFLRRTGQEPGEYSELSEAGRVSYEVEAEVVYKETGARPAILNEYEAYDTEGVDGVPRVAAELAEALLAHKAPDSPLTFVDMHATMPARNALERLASTRAGELLAADDEQLAIESDGSYYPQLDLRKQALALRGVGVRAWGWSSDQKVRFTNGPGEPYSYPEDCLYFPSGEVDKWYELDITFSYTSDSDIVTETLALAIGSGGNLRLSRSVWCTAYAETGYEGHAMRQLKDSSDDDANAFLEVLVDALGDNLVSAQEYRAALGLSTG